MDIYKCIYIIYIYIILYIFFFNIRLSILKGCTGIDPGDEGNALGGSYMVFHWQCDLAPFLSDSGSSRYLITTVPTTAYVYDHDVNITLQSVAQHICRSLVGLRISIPMTGIDRDPWQILVCMIFLHVAHHCFSQNQPLIQRLHATHSHGVQCKQGIYGCLCDGVQG